MRPKVALASLAGFHTSNGAPVWHHYRMVLADEFDVGFAPALLLNDLRICQALCEEAEFTSGVLRQAIPDYQQLIDSGETGRDISALIRTKVS